jgi:hypothetical protein
MDYRKIIKRISKNKKILRVTATAISIIAFTLIIAFSLSVGPYKNYQNTKKQSAEKEKTQGLQASDADSTSENPQENEPVPESSPTNTAIVADDKNIVFKHDPYTLTIDGKPYAMVPAKEFLDAIGVEYTEYPGSGMIVTYKNNMTSKFIPNSEFGYRNGKKYKLKSPVTTKNGVLYTPLEFVTKTYGYSLTEKSGAFYAKALPHTETFKTFDDMYYKSIDIPSLEASISIPQFWNRISSTPFKYGFSDESENIGMEISSFKSTQSDIAKIADTYYKDFLQETGLTDSLDMTFLTPSFFVNSDDTKVTNISKLNTYKFIQQIDQARSLYNWTVKNIAIVPNESSKNSTNVIDSYTGSVQEANILYCALLRSAKIPARIATGESKGKIIYWTEIQINGSWIVSDITSEFSIPISEFYEGKKKIKRLEY